MAEMENNNFNGFEMDPQPAADEEKVLTAGAGFDDGGFNEDVPAKEKADDGFDEDTPAKASKKPEKALTKSKSKEKKKDKSKEQSEQDKKTEKEKKEKEKQAKRYPHKKYMNLAVKEKSGVNLLVAIPVILLLCVGAMVFSKFMIVDRFAKVEAAEAEVAQLQQTSDALTAYVADYAAVEEEYQRYSTKWMTNEESGTVSRMDMLSLIEEEFMQYYDVMNISSTGNVISLKIAGADLETMSGIVQKLYARKDVAKVEVSSANNTEIVTETTTVENEDGTEEEVEEEIVIDVMTIIITMKQVEEEEAAA